MTTPADFPAPALREALRLRGFRVYRPSVPAGNQTAFVRRHFYKIVLSVGRVAVRYGTQELVLDGAYLLCFNPLVPYAVRIDEMRAPAYSCVFTEEFLRPQAGSGPLARLPDPPFLALPDAAALARFTGLFEQLLAAEASDYRYRDELLRTYLQLIGHAALELRPAEHAVRYPDALARVTARFLELLERQFPRENPQSPLRLRSAQDYAERLAVHVNYLNRAVKATTGQSTTACIAVRVAAEAVALLQHTDWRIADIAEALGFDYPNYFSSFLRKATGRPPRSYRAPAQI